MHCPDHPRVHALGSAEDDDRDICRRNTYAFASFRYISSYSCLAKCDFATGWMVIGSSFVVDVLIVGNGRSQVRSHPSESHPHRVSSSEGSQRRQTRVICIYLLLFKYKYLNSKVSSLGVAILSNGTTGKLNVVAVLFIGNTLVQKLSYKRLSQSPPFIHCDGLRIQGKSI